jgi:uncharacterized C2H2 Zn-finger protein
MVFYKCEKCNKEFNQKCNYISHINKKFSCINTNEDKNIIIYKCDKCNKEFNQKCNYITHINRKIPCDGIDKENNQLLLKVKELEQENSIKQNKIILLEEENKKINELYNNLLDKCIKNNSNNNIITNTVNNNNNTINITLKNFGNDPRKRIALASSRRARLCEPLADGGNDNYTKLTNEEQIRILKSNKQCVSNLIK